MTSRTPGPYPLPEISMESWIVRFDENGVCTSPGTRDALLAALEAAPDRPVIVFSHGWNNDFAAATSLYTRFLQNFESVARDAPLSFAAKPIFIGLTWPSIWLAFDQGPQLAAAADRSAQEDAVVAALRRVLPKETDWPKFYALLESDRLGKDEAREFAGLIAPALQGGEREGPRDAPPTELLVLQAMERLQRASSPSGSAGYDLRESGTIDGASATAGANTAGGLDFLDPRNALRLASLYIMKDRAGLVGAVGVAELLRAVLTRSRRVFLVGHSFGCKVVMSAVCAAPLPRVVAGVLLLQPAISYLAFANRIAGLDLPGAYHGALERVEKPIFVTYSGNDLPLHSIYHLALMREKDIGEGPRAAAASTSAGAPPNMFAALGGYGPRDCDETLIDPMPDAGGTYDYPATARVVGVDGTAGKRIDSHGGVATPGAAWALRKLMD